jgi:hypothetical protein
LAVGHSSGAAGLLGLLDGVPAACAETRITPVPLRLWRLPCRPAARSARR